MKNKGMLLFVGMCVALLLISSAPCLLAASTDFPKKAITWIVPYGPGGGFDVYSRAITRFMPKYLPQKVNMIVKNMPGGGGRRATGILYRSKPDGYTVGMVNIPGHIVTQMIMETQYDLTKVPYLGRCAEHTYVLTVPKDSPFRSIKHLQQAKEPVRFALTGGGTVLLVSIIGPNVMNVPYTLVTGYKTMGEVPVALMRGDADASMPLVTTVLPYIQKGDLKPLVVFSDKKSEFLPDAPTAKEMGYDELASLSLQRMIVAPPGTPKDRVAILEKALMQTLKDEGLREWSKKAKRPLSSAPGKEAREITLRLAKLFERYKDMLKSALIK